MSRGRCLVGVKIMIFEPGQEADEEYLEFLEDATTLWKLPPGCTGIWDCVTKVHKEKFWIIEHFPKQSRPEERQIYRFTKWAVGFNFSHIGDCSDSFGISAQSPLEWEVYHIGERDVFVGWQDELIELAQPFFEQINQADGNSHSVNFPTIWVYEAGRAYFYEGSEWETNWQLEGRLELDSLKLVEAEAQQ